MNSRLLFNSVESFYRGLCAPETWYCNKLFKQSVCFEGRRMKSRFPSSWENKKGFHLSLLCLQRSLTNSDQFSFSLLVSYRVRRNSMPLAKVSGNCRHRSLRFNMRILPLVLKITEIFSAHLSRRKTGVVRVYAERKSVA